MKKYLFIAMSLLFILSCDNGHKENISKHVLYDRPLPKDILSIYLKETSLRDIDKGVDSFEIRKWYPFYFIDSFPTALERFYFEEGLLKGEYYLFSTKEGKRVRTKSDLAGMQVEKYEFKNIPNRFLDSLQIRYNFSQIDSFDVEIINKKNSDSYSTATPRNVFFEQSSATHYYGVFITEPGLYPGLNKSVDKYAAFAKFTLDSMCLTNKEFEKWAEVRLKRIYGFE
jgi:hypothetical protein